MTEWLNDIKRTQLPSILGGVGPVHSFVQLFQGVVDLVWLPIEQYKRDGRVMRGLQRGANSFTTSSAMAFLELTNRVVHVVQVSRNDKRAFLCIRKIRHKNIIFNRGDTISLDVSDVVFKVTELRFPPMLA